MGQSKPFTARSILIVEDEALIRFDLIDLFEDAGYCVSEAENADDAIAILERDNSIRIVLTDVQMPGSMDGLKLAHHIRERFPPTVLVVTSGVLNPACADLPANSFFLSKPFDHRRLLRQIECMNA